MRPSRRSPQVALVIVALALGVAVPACSEDAPTPAPAPGVVKDPPGTMPLCAAPTGPGTEHQGSLAADEVWTAATGPHVITSALSIGAGRTLTIEACAVVRLKGNTGVLVEGRLLTNGIADKLVRFERADADVAWASLEARKGSELRLSHTTFEGGGNPDGARLAQVAMLDIRGDQDLAPQPVLFVDNVGLKGSASLGVQLREGGAFAPGSTALTIVGSASFPVSVWARSAGTLPAGDYTGNATDEVFLPANGGRDDVREDMTLAARGVPYRIGGEPGGSSFVVGATSGPSPLLTIEAGVTLRFAKNARLLVDGTDGKARGALSAVGTSERPIVFTSAEASPAPGDWSGLLVSGAPDPRDAIAHARIAYAGGPSQVSSFGCPSALAKDFGNEGSVVIYGGAPGSAFVTHTTIENGDGDGIVRGWTGAPVDFLGGNTFTNVARCWQTFPKPSVGVCEDPAPCPR